jgi:hypothetical protein
MITELTTAKRRAYGIDHLDPGLQGETIDAHGSVMASPRRLVSAGRTAHLEPYAVVKEPWEAVAATGARRRASREAQRRGERVFVNLSAPKRFREICMLGEFRAAGARSRRRAIFWTCCATSTSTRRNGPGALRSCSFSAVTSASRRSARSSPARSTCARKAPERAVREGPYARVGFARTRIAAVILV